MSGKKNGKLSAIFSNRQKSTAFFSIQIWAPAWCFLPYPAFGRGKKAPGARLSVVAAAANQRLQLRQFYCRLGGIAGYYCPSYGAAPQFLRPQAMHPYVQIFWHSPLPKTQGGINTKATEVIAETFFMPDQKE